MTNKPNTITVKILRNISPGPEMGVPKSEFDELGRIRKGKIVALPSEFAKDLIKSKIASSDAAFAES